ncbi:hypothetical protein A3J56_00500 [Candidatus Giovannonibacteria bacterium RIFCSPHIGHO2_02_FULL_46_20]|uniref:D-alanine--D-alanine ligase n=1 Tax=Candidatus Giovannonibacteria bacterium RIFCSPHIGHO2_02_FULL_46_20 TaxID=1798338 RepID=A0A1F5WFC6_9BACT|nr:MAG: hypothetical protein A3J56_00500 [Candidatus Giovannonibacteria bacterium RIFCSPHIGHO2_02_FULL_46_20]
MQSKKLRVLVLGGGPSVEHEVSLRTAQMIYEHLDRALYEPRLATITKDGAWLIAPFPPLGEEEAVSKIKSVADIVFVALHGEYGEDGTVQRLFDKHGIRYTGSGPRASFVGMHKLLSRDRFRAAGLLVPQGIGISYTLYDRAQNDVVKLIARNFSFPVVAKPADRGSSIGVSIVHALSYIERGLHNVFHYSPLALTEAYIHGREIACGILEDENGNTAALPPTEIIPRKNIFFDYESKYADGGADEITPARVSLAIQARIQEAAIAAHRAIGCRGYSRADFIWRPETDQLFVLEINTLPGLTKASILPKEAQAAGISFPHLLDRIISSAIETEVRLQ